MMFRRSLQSTYHHLRTAGLVVEQQQQQQLMNQFAIQKRYFVKQFFKKGEKTTLKLFLVSFASGIALISYYDYKKKAKPDPIRIQSANKEWDSVQRKITDALISDSLVGNYLDASILDNLKIHKKIDGKNAIAGKRLVLLQYTNCPFCCKVRTFLNYYGIPYEIVEVNPLTRKQIKFSTNYRKVPILLIEDAKLREESNRVIQLNDSSSIVSILGTYLFCNKEKEPIESIINKYESLQYTDLEQNKQIKEISNKYFLLYGDTINGKQFKEMETELLNERKFRKWTDEVFVHVLSPNIYRSVSEAVQAFNYFSEVSDWEKIFSTFERLSVVYVGSYAMYLLSKYLKKKYQLKEDVRQSLYDDCNYFLKSKGSSNEFMGGSQPNLSDLSVFGVLSSIEGCDAFKDLIENTKIRKWYFTMKQLVDEQKGTDLLNI